MKDFLAKLHFSKEPIVWITVIVAALIVGNDVIFNHKSLGEVLTENYVGHLMALAGVIAARFLVFAPANVEKADDDPSA